MVNILAHLYLSGSDMDVMAGNFIGDFVKGKQVNDYPPLWQMGIMLHRHIDDFTDHHEQVRQSKSRLTGGYGKYAGVVTDIFYDHFLATQWHKYSRQTYNEFVREKYDALLDRQKLFPEEMKWYFQKFIENSWLHLYEKTEGISKVLTGMSRRTSMPAEADYAMGVLMDNYKLFQVEFNVFFPQLMEDLRINFGVDI